ncbi:hypothetical protein VTK73DRAFT_7661 [Phialemonium thermophilum]|uniref:TLC domain-containing protein n=1 Tax=Phialemonium thermophilum TaxID=223376 RepID=A0ABR3Y7X0_9PEZI
MKDPFFLPPIPALANAIKPWADRLSLPVLTLHAHEILAFALFYTFIHLVLSPVISIRFFPSYYPRNSRGKRVNWDAHVVSLVQSVLINIVALWVMTADEERRQMDWQERIWGYTGASGLVQAMAIGYFVWDFIVTLLYIDVFGVGLLAHAVSALTVYSLGSRPFLNYYATDFILYELSTPFLNVHWFFDKLHMTGSKAQLYNGIALLVTFFSCRLVWGTYESAWVYIDMFRAMRIAPTASSVKETMVFVKDARPIPVWLGVVYISSNLVLNSLNWHWFFKMIAAVKKRFEPPMEAEKKEPAEDGVASSQATGAERPVAAHRRKRSTIETFEEIVPDSEELREGTIQ